MEQLESTNQLLLPEAGIAQAQLAEKRQRQKILFFMLFVVMVGAYYFTTLEEGTHYEVVSTSSRDSQRNKTQKESASKDSAELVPEETLIDRVDGQNPYLNLPVLLPVSMIGHYDALELWSESDSEFLKEGPEHHFLWQKYKRVSAIVHRQKKGAEQLLWPYLTIPKLWLRMSVLFGLARYGKQVELGTVKRVLETSRGDLIKRTFERYINKSSNGDRMVLKQIIRFVPWQARLDILKALHKGHDSQQDLYLTAALMDEEAKVRNWAKRALDHMKLPIEQYETLLSQVEGHQLEQHDLIVQEDFPFEALLTREKRLQKMLEFQESQAEE